VDGASCGLENMAVGREYVVFATGGERLTANLCGGTAPTRAALAARIQRLSGPAHEPSAPPSGHVSTSSTSAWALVGLAGLVAAATTALTLRRRTSHA
jgi:hypothetical protein